MYFKYKRRDLEEGGTLALSIFILFSPNILIYLFLVLYNNHKKEIIIKYYIIIVNNKVINIFKNYVYFNLSKKILPYISDSGFK